MMMAMMAAMALAAAPVSMEFDGSLKDGLKQLAQKSGLNLVVIGEFDEHVNLNLPSVNGEEALETIAQAYGLQVTRAASSKMWVIRRAEAPPVTPVTGGVPVPLVPLKALTPEAARESADRAREAADQAREQADTLRRKAESMRNATEDAREKAQQAAEDAREQAQEAAEAAREQAQEAAELAREQAQEAREQAQEAAEAEREKAEALRDQSQAQADLSRAKAELERHRVSTGGPVTIEKGSRVDTAVAYGGPVIVEEDAVVDGDAVAFGGDVILKKGAVVEGDAVSFGGSVQKAEGATVHGESVSMGGSGIGTAVARNMVKQQKVTQSDEAGDSKGGFGRGLAGFLLQFAALFGLGFMMMMFAPQRMKALEATIKAEPVKNGLAGLVGLVTLLPLTAILVFTLVGIPVVLVMLPTLVLFIIPVGLAALANVVGSKLPTGKLRKTQALVLAVGLFAMLLALHIPGLWVLVLLVTAAISFGAIIRTRFGQSSRGTPMLDPMQNTAPIL